jgi:hypothetical protein
VADKPDDVANKEEDEPTPLKGIKPDSSSSQQVSRHACRFQCTMQALTFGRLGQIKEQLVWDLAEKVDRLDSSG